MLAVYCRFNVVFTCVLPGNLWSKILGWEGWVRHSPLITQNLHYIWKGRGKREKEEEWTSPRYFSDKKWGIFIISRKLTELSEQVMTCLKLGLNRTQVTGSLCVIVMSACFVGLQRKKKLYHTVLQLNWWKININNHCVT